MKRTLLAVALLSLGLQGIAHATFPADAEASHHLPAADTYANMKARGESSPAWGVSKRQVEAHNPFPFGGGFVDD